MVSLVLEIVEYPDDVAEDMLEKFCWVFCRLLKLILGLTDGAWYGDGA